MNSEELEIRALLATSGEAQLTAAEAEQSAVWRAEVARLAQLSREGLGAPIPEALRKRLRLQAGRPFWRVSRNLLLWRAAAAAALLALVWSGVDDYRLRREAQRLQRLHAVLLLIGAETASDEVSADATRESLAARLLLLQTAGEASDG